MPVGHDREDIEGVGVQDSRDAALAGFAKKVHQGVHGAGGPAKSRTNGKGAVALKFLGDCAEVTARVFGKHGGRVGGRCRKQGPRGGVKHYQAAAGAEGRPCCQKGRAGHGLASGNDQEPAVVVLMGVVLAAKQPRTKEFGCDFLHVHILTPQSYKIFRLMQAALRR